MNKKILIFGNGQMGNFYKAHFDKNNIFSEITSADITNKEDVKTSIEKFEPNIVINTAAKTNLEWCSENKLETFNVNVLGADNIAQICDEKNIHFIHLSSGCIFESKDENDAKVESDKTEPAAFYSWTKVWAEQMIQFNKSKDFKWMILRPRQPISTEVNYKNMLVKMLLFSKFIDTPNTGTVIEDLMDWTLKLIEEEFVGVIHVANEGWATPYEIGLLIKKHILPELEPEKITKEELDKITPNKRVDTVLNVDLLKKIVEPDLVKPYKERLEDVIIKLGENIRNDNKEHLKEELEKTMDQMKKRSIPNNVWKNLLK